MYVAKWFDPFTAGNWRYSKPVSKKTAEGIVKRFGGSVQKVVKA